MWIITWNRNSLLLAPAFLLAFPANLVTAGGGEKTALSSITPDAKIQALLIRALKGEEDNDARDAMKELNHIALRTPEILAPQIVYVNMHAKSEKEAWGALGLIKHFGTRWNSEMRRGLIPLLESGDEKMLEVVGGWLGAIDGHALPRPEINVLAYRETLMRQKKSPPPGLVTYVFTLAPDKALFLFGEIYTDPPPPVPLSPPRSLLWSGHVVTTTKWRLVNNFLKDGDLENVRKELDALSKHEGWYARRYVVEVMRDIPKLGTPEIANRLKKDANPLVSRPAALIP